MIEAACTPFMFVCNEGVALFQRGGQCSSRPVLTLHQPLPGVTTPSSYPQLPVSPHSPMMFFWLLPGTLLLVSRPYQVSGGCVLREGFYLSHISPVVPRLCTMPDCLVLTAVPCVNRNCPLSLQKCYVPPADTDFRVASMRSTLCRTIS